MTVNWNKAVYSVFDTFGMKKMLSMSHPTELWRDLPTLIAVAGDLDFSEDNTAHSCLPSSL